MNGDELVPLLYMLGYGGTPHHADCWAYLGRRGIFGRGGRPNSA